MAKLNLATDIRRSIEIMGDQAQRLLTNLNTSSFASTCTTFANKANQTINNPESMNQNISPQHLPS